MGDAEQTIVLTDEEGHEHEFTIIDVIEVDERQYAVLLPVAPLEAEAGEEEPEGIEDAVILRLEQDEKGDDVLVDIEDDDEWERVAQAWEESLEEEFEDGDEDEDEDEDR